MAGKTATIDRETLAVQWNSYQPMAAICQYWTITVHQLVRLREVWEFPPRNDRKLRYKPTREERMLDPDDAELAASEATLDLAPAVAARVTCVQTTWSAEVRQERLATRPTVLRLSPLQVPDDARAELEEEQMPW